MTKQEDLSACPSFQRWATIKQIAAMQRYSWLTESAIRHLVHEASDRTGSKGAVIPGNGLASAVIRIGRKVLIDLDLFDEWIASHRGDQK